MRLISHKPAHQDAINKGMPVTVNGVKFIRGDDGRPTSESISERQVNLFRASPGFSIYHDDGVYSGPTGNAPRLIDQASARLAAAADEAKAHDALERMMSAGNLTPQALAALDRVVPHVGQAPAPQPISTVNVTSEGAVIVSAPSEGQPTPLIVPSGTPTPPSVTPAAPAPVQAQAEQKPAPSPAAATQHPADPDHVDMSDPESLMRLNRPALMGMARSFGIHVVGKKNPVIAQEIATAFRATPEYLAATGGSATVQAPEQPGEPQPASDTPEPQQAQANADAAAPQPPATPE